MTITRSHARFDPAALRAEFPALDQQVHGHPLVYLDNAATTQKPRVVIEAVSNFFEQDNANVHRGVHLLSQRATDSFDRARTRLREYVNAASDVEIIFTKGCTEAINLVAASWGRSNLKPGDEILLSTMEHHADIVPWQQAAEATGALVRPIPITPEGVVDWGAFRSMLSERTKLVGMVHVSNSLGTVNCPGSRNDSGGPPFEWIDWAHAVGAKVLLDGAQALAHMRVDVRSLDVDFYTMSGHKMYGPTGIGALYAKQEILESMPPYQTGGDMIRKVSFEKTTFAGLPNKFEPGTPNMAGAVGWAAAIEFLSGFDPQAVAAHEKKLAEKTIQALRQIEGATLVGSAQHRAGVVSFTMDCAHPHDVGTILDREGVAIRVGHHCCMPLMTRLGIPGTARASFGLYNTDEDVDRLIAGCRKVLEVFR